MRHSSDGTNVYNSSEPLLSHNGQYSLVHIDHTEEIHFKLCFGIFQLRKFYRTGNTVACTVNQDVHPPVFGGYLVNGNGNTVLIGYINADMGNSVDGVLSAAELVDRTS